VGKVHTIPVFKSLQNKQGKKIKSVSCFNCESMMAGKEMMGEKILTLYFVLRQTLQIE
jgi:hypothetical protein